MVLAKWNKYVFTPRGMKAIGRWSRSIYQLAFDNGTHNSQSSAEYYVVDLHFAFPATKQAADAAINSPVWQDDVPPALCCCMPKSNYNVSENDVSDVAMESRYAAANLAFSSTYNSSINIPMMPVVQGMVIPTRS